MGKGIGLVLLGVAAVVIGLFLLLPEVGRTGTADAAVVDVDGRESSGHRTVLRFTTATGREVTGIARTRGAPATGTRMPVRYDPDNPSDFDIGTRDAPFSIGFLVPGGLVLALGLFVTWDAVHERRWRHAHPETDPA